MSPREYDADKKAGGGVYQVQMFSVNLFHIFLSHTEVAGQPCKGTTACMEDARIIAGYKDCSIRGKGRVLELTDCTFHIYICRANSDPLLPEEQQFIPRLFQGIFLCL